MRSCLRFLAGLSLLAALFAAAGCALPGGSQGSSTASAPHELTLDEQAEAIVKSMSLTEKVGQMVMIGIKGTEVSEDALYMLHQYHVGGIVLFDRNLQSAEQTRRLIDGLQAQSEEKLPLWLALDEEGGKVARGRQFIPAPPSQQAIGEGGRPEAAREWAVRTAENLTALGFNLNFAPVADLGSPRERSYSRDPQKAAAFVQAAAAGYAERQMLCTLKHFPGIGYGLVDSHIEGSSIVVSREEMQRRELVPFAALIARQDAGPRCLVMVSHLTYPALDDKLPASLSPAVVQGLLRQEMGFDGVVITDDLEMGAVSRHYAFREAALKAVQAGADVVLVCHEYQHEQEAYLGILEAVQSGTLSEARIDESARRIVKAKLQQGLKPRS